MPIPEDKLRAALEMLKLRELRDLGYERDVDISSNRKDDWVDEFVRQNWSSEAFSELIGWIELLEREEQPRGQYMVEIDDIGSLSDDEPSEEVKRKLNERTVEFSEDKSNIVSEGFELEDSTSNGIQGTFWSKTDDYVLDPLGELRATSKIYGTGFEIDLDADRIYIQASLPAKAQRLLNTFSGMGLGTTPIGYQDLMNDIANEKMESFVNEFEEELEALDDQQRFGDFVSRLQIKQVKIEVDEQSIKRVDFNGRRNIFDHDDVRMFVEDRDGRVVQIEGVMKYNGQEFYFKVGYTENFGLYTIEKKGKRDGNLSIVDEADEFLNEMYQEHFADI